MPLTEKEFLLEHLLYDCELNRPLQQFLKNIKLIASQRDEIFSAIDFAQDHPMEKAVRAMLAATLMHLDLGMFRFCSLFNLLISNLAQIK